MPSCRREGTARRQKTKILCEEFSPKGDIWVSRGREPAVGVMKNQGSRVAAAARYQNTQRAVQFNGDVASARSRSCGVCVMAGAAALRLRFFLPLYRGLPPAAKTNVALLGFSLAGRT